MDLYAILECEKTDALHVIKASYRRLSKMYHPDVAGNDHIAKFQEIAAAWKVLSDPDRRVKYDETGVVDETTIFNEHNEMMACLAQVFQALLESGKAMNRQTNILQLIRSLLDGNIDKTIQGLATIDDQIAALNDLLPEVVREDEGVNPFKMIINANIDQFKKNQETQEIRLKILRLAREEIEKYKSFKETIDMMSAFPRAGMYSSIFTTSSSGSTL